MDIQEIYLKSYVGWDKFYDEDELRRMSGFPERLDTPPLRNKVNPPEIIKHFDYKLLSTSTPSMVFRRYPNLYFPDCPSDILVKALLGFPDILAYRYAGGACILNDAWPINLRSTTEQKENIMMDAFLKGFAYRGEEGDKKEKIKAVEVTDELRDLMKVYVDAEEHLKTRELQSLTMLHGYMKRYIEVQEERASVTQKLNALKAKMNPSPEECDEEEDEE